MNNRAFAMFRKTCVAQDAAADHPAQRAAFSWGAAFSWADARSRLAG